jgi:hypothetical protein
MRAREGSWGCSTVLRARTRRAARMDSRRALTWFAGNFAGSDDGVVSGLVSGENCESVDVNGWGCTG